jgi:hypothetical protein
LKRGAFKIDFGKPLNGGPQVVKSCKNIIYDDCKNISVVVRIAS